MTYGLAAIGTWRAHQTKSKNKLCQKPNKKLPKQIPTYGQTTFGIVKCTPSLVSQLLRGAIFSILKVLSDTQYFYILSHTFLYFLILSHTFSYFLILYNTSSYFLTLAHTYSSFLIIFEQSQHFEVLIKHQTFLA